MIHFVKYNIIGVINTGITLAVVWVLHQILDIDVVVSNFIGYVAGGLNSYFWNKYWNFQSKQKDTGEALRFIVVFAICYFLNLGILLGTKALLANWSPLVALATWCAPFVKPGYIAHVVAIVASVLSSFFLYKKIVFRKAN